MLDIKLIREHPEIVKKNLKKRKENEKLKWVDDLLKYDKKWRELVQRVNDLRRKRNIITQEIAQLKKKKKDVKAKMKEVKAIPERFKPMIIRKKLRQF